jgi:hypothetical protein
LWLGSVIWNGYADANSSEKSSALEEGINISKIVVPTELALQIKET